MLTIDQHFASGHLPASIGAYFNLAQLLSEHARSPVPALREAVADEVPRLRSTAEWVKEKVRFVQALAELAGFEPPPPPRTPDEYHAWFEAVHGGFRDALPLHHPHEVTQMVGHRLGDLLCSWNLLLLTLRLLIADPESPLLVQQIMALRKDLVDTSAALRVHARHPALPAVLFALAERFAAAVDELLALPLSDAGPGELALAGRHLNGRMQELSAALTEAQRRLAETVNAADA